jgi:hypothetical protein
LETGAAPPDREIARKAIVTEILTSFERFFAAIGRQ